MTRDSTSVAVWTFDPNCFLGTTEVSVAKRRIKMPLTRDKLDALGGFVRPFEVRLNVFEV